MSREDNFMYTGCATSPDDRTKILVTIESGLDGLLAMVDGPGWFGRRRPRHR